MAGRFFWLVMSLLALAMPVTSRAGDRVALIVANGDYSGKFTKLASPLSDAMIVEQALKSAGFKVTVVKDRNLGDLKRAIQTFGDEAVGKEVALFYFAGHGFEVAGKNYLIPIAAEIDSPRNVDIESVTLDAVRAEMALARMRVLVLDACRDNPFTKGSGGGLAAVEASTGEAVLFSTSPGTPALDANGKYSPFARSFARQILMPGVEIDLTFRRIHDDVMLETRSQQQPTKFNSLSGTPFFFVAPIGSDDRGQPQYEIAVGRPSFDPRQIEAGVWQGTLIANSLSAVQDYLSRYPQGSYAVQAREIVTRLAAGSATARQADPSDLKLSAADAHARGFAYYFGRGVPVDFVQAARWYRRAADGGDASGMVGLGIMYEGGRGGLPKDDAQAVQWYRRAADGGDAFGMSALGVMYANGLGGLPKDDAQAVQWYRRAAAVGNPYGMSNLGVMYGGGRGGLPKDDAQAVQWLRRAADGGDAFGMAELGAMYEGGRGGLPKDDAQAALWRQKAAAKSTP